MTIFSGLKSGGGEELQQSNVTARLLVVLMICTAAINLNILYNGFVFDDIYQIVGNQWIRSIRFIPEIFTHDVFNGEGAQSSNFYRPMMQIVYLLTYQVFSLKAWGFHLVNILLHCAVTAMVFLILSHKPSDSGSAPIASSPVVSFVAALLFALHPVHSEVVAWAACVPELSFTLFGLLSVYFNMKSHREFTRPYYLSVTFFALALLCKETAVTLLPILFLYDWAVSKEKPGTRRYLMKYFPFLLATAGYALLRFDALNGAVPNKVHQDLTLFQTLINVMVLFSQYLWKLFLPVNLSAYYVFHPAPSSATLGTVTSMIAVAAFLVLLGASFKKSRTAFWGMLVMVIPLLPAFYIQGLGEAVFAERYLYFPSVGFVLVVGSVLSCDGARLHRFQQPMVAALLLVIALFAVATLQRNRVWHDEMSLWSDTIKKAPDGFIPQQNLGMTYYKNGDLKNAEKYLSLVCSHKDVSIKSLTALAGIYVETDRPEMSLDLLQRAEELSPQNPQILIMLSNAYKTLGKEELAQSYHKKAETIFPDLDQVLSQRVLGLCRDGERLLSENKVPEAEVRIREAYSTMPGMVEVLIDMGSLLATKGDTAKALEYFNKAVAKAPSNPIPHFNMSMLYEMMGKTAEANRELIKSKELEAEAKDR